MIRDIVALNNTMGEETMLTKEEIFEVLTDWNYWGRPLPTTVIRQSYNEEIARKFASGEILILKGVRRSGKSTLLINEIKRLTAGGLDPRNILYVNFEDPRFYNHLTLELMEKIREVYLEYLTPSDKPIIMLDEVQNIEGWEKWSLKEYGLKQSSLYITGSSSALLSKEIGTALTGRYLDIEVFPLSFKEFLHFNKLTIDSQAERTRHRTKLNQMFRLYLNQGGFPKLLEFEDAELKRDTLKIYYDSILLRDIVARHSLTNYRALEEMSAFLLANNASCNSTNNLKKTFAISFDSARNYTSYLEDAYLIFQLRRFDWSVKKQLVNPRKFYSIDTGLSNCVSFQTGARKGQNLENIIFLELLRRKCDIYYYKTKNNREVDFLVKEGKEVTELIQVSYSIEDEKTRKREVMAMKTAVDELSISGPIRCTLLTMDKSGQIDRNGLQVDVRNVIDWLLFP